MKLKALICHSLKSIIVCLVIGYDQYGPQRKTTFLWVFGNSKGADQPAHLQRLIHTFVFRFLACFVSKLATGEISIFKLVSVAEQLV